jgi:two-component system, chemotaxis family, sensor kinase Cph1
VEQTITNLGAAVQESGAVVTHDPLPTLRANCSQLLQLFQNLIGNAIKFRGAKVPAIHIRAEKKKPTEWLFSVTDNGIGIASEHADMIFIIFKRLHGRTEYPGNGIGLSICKRIVEHHGGRIWADSQPRHGTSFQFTLPIRESSGKD